MPLARPYRLVVVGSSGVGKTALIEQLVFGNHVVGLGTPETLGDIYEAQLSTESNSWEQVQIFDTSGKLFTIEELREGTVSSDQEHFISIADGVLLVYDITSRSSYELITAIRHRIHLLLRHKECPIVAIGNKYDLNGIRDVDPNQVQQWTHSQAIRSFETTVLDRESLKEPFTYITKCKANYNSTIPGVHSSLTKAHEEFLDDSKSLLSGSPVKQSFTGSPGRCSSGQRSSSEDPFEDAMPRRARLSAQQLFADDVTYPKGGLLGLADCMGNKQKGKG